MNAHIVLVGNPFDPIRSRHVIDVTEPVAIGDWIAANIVEAKFPFLRGTQEGWLYDWEWDSYEIKDGDRVALIAYPQGGQGGGRKNTLSTVLMLALVVATSFAGGIGGAAVGAAGGVSGAGGLTVATPLLGAGTLTPLGSFVAATINAAVVAGGSYLINLALPPNIPKGQDAPSPTYSVTSRGNQARLGAVQEVQYGRVLRYPSLASASYREFSDDGIDDITGEAVIGTQTLFELYSLGWGSFDVEEYNLVGEDIEAFSSQIEVYKYEPGEPVTAFPTNVITVDSAEGAEFKFPDQLLDGTYEDVVDHEGLMTAVGEISATRYYIDDSAANFGATDGLIGKTLYFVVDAPGGFYTIHACIAANTATRIEWDAPADTYLAGKKPTVGADGVWRFENGQYDRSATADYEVLTHNNWLGEDTGFEINVSTEYDEIGSIGVDIVLPEGNWYQSKTPPNDAYPVAWRFEARKYDDAGDPDGPWFEIFNPEVFPTPIGSTLSTQTLNNGAIRANGAHIYIAGRNEKPVRFSKRAEVADGRYRVRARCATRTGITQPGVNPDVDTKIHASSVWAGLRGYGTTQGQSWAGRTMIAIKTKADASVNSSTLRQFSVLCTRKLRDYVGGGAGGLVNDGTLGAAPFTTTSGSSLVSVAAPAGLVSQLLDGALLTWSASAAVGGIPAALLNQEFPVTLTGDESLEFDVSFALADDPVTTTAESASVKFATSATLAGALSVSDVVQVAGAEATGTLPAVMLNGSRTISSKGADWVAISLPSYSLPSNPLHVRKGSRPAAVGFVLPADLAALLTENVKQRVTISGSAAVGGVPSTDINTTVDLIRIRAETAEEMFRVTVTPGDVWGYFAVTTTPTSNVAGGGGASVVVQVVAQQTATAGGTDVSISMLATSTATGGGSSVAYTVGEWTQIQPSRRISSAMIDAATDTDYGAKLALTRLDLERLKNHELTWDARDRYELDGVTWKAAPVKDRFDFVFDSRQPFYDAENLIARCGRAHVVWPAGIMTVVRDEPRALATAMYTPRNMLPKSLEISYLFPTLDTPDHLIVEFFNEDIWDWDEVVVSELAENAEGYPGDTAGRIRFPGITQPYHAWREGAYEYGSTKYRRRTINFSTDAEGHIPLYGDLIEVSHDVPAWGQWGHIIGYEVGDTTATITLSEPVDWGDTPITPTSHVIQLKDEFGRPSLAGLAYCQPGPEDDQVVIDGAFVEEDIELHTVDRYLREATSYSFGVAEQNRLQAIVTGLRPHGSSKVDVEAYTYRVAGVYDADGDLTYVPPTQTQQLDRETAGPAVRDLRALLSAFDGTNAASIRCNWATAPWARYYIVETSTDDGATWTRRGRTEGTSFEFRVEEGGYREAVVESSLTAGPSTNAGFETILARNPTYDPTEWVAGQFDGMILAWTSGSRTGQRVQIRRTVYASPSTQALYLADRYVPKPVVGEDTYDIVELRPVIMRVAVRAVNRLEGPRSTVDVDLSPLAASGYGAVVNGAGELYGERSLGVGSVIADDDTSTRVDLWRFDTEGNLFLRGRLYSESVAPDVWAVYVGEPVEPEGGTFDTFELPRAPRNGDAIMFFVGDRLWERVDTYVAETFGKYVVDGTTVTLCDATGGAAHFIMVADSETGDMAGVRVGEPVAFVPDTTSATLPFTPYDGSDVLVYLNGYPLFEVDATPAADEYTRDGTALTTGATLLDGDVLLVLGVDNLASEIAKKFRVAKTTSETLPVTPLFPDEVALALQGGGTQWYDRTPVDGEFALTGSPPLNVTWPTEWPPVGTTKYAVAMTAAEASAPPVSYLTALGSISQAFTATTTITVTHNFGAFPVVNVIDSAGEVLVPESILHTSVDAFTVTLLSATTGTVVASLGGGVTEAVTISAKTGSPTLGAAEYFVNYVGAGGTMALPALSGLTIRPRIIKNSGTGALVVDPDGAETIDGESNFTVLPLRSITIYPDATGWLVV